MNPKPHTPGKYRHLRLLMLAIPLLLTPFAQAQGCTQCRDNTAATSPQTQAGYRHAIGLMIVTASSIFLGTVVMLRRNR